MPRPALGLGEGDGDVRAEDDVGSEDDDDPGADDADADDAGADDAGADDDGAVAVEPGAEVDAVAMGGLGVTDVPPLLLVGVPGVPEVEAGLVLVAVLEADAEFAP